MPTYTYAVEIPVRLRTSGLSADTKSAESQIEAMARRAASQMQGAATSASAGMGLTWKQFTAERMSEYMRMEGSHGAAMKRMGAEWQAYKQSGMSANQSVRKEIETTAAAARAATKAIGDNANPRAAEQLQRQRSAALIAQFREQERAAARSAATRTRAEAAAAKEVARINRETARQAAEQDKIRERAAKTLADAQVREAKRGANEFLRSMQQMSNASGRTAQASSLSFSTLLGASFFADLGSRAASAFYGRAQQIVGDATRLSQDAQNAFKGLESVAVFKGIDPQSARQAIEQLRFVRGGIISLADASVGLRNLLASGFSFDQATQIMERFSDASAFGKQAALDYGYAIRSATEGIKNQNSILVDNVGVTKNLSVILAEAGFQMADLSSKTKGQAARMALFNGLMAETEAQVGDADRVMQGYTGTVAAQDQAYRNLQRAIGDIITSNPQLLESNRIVTEQIKGLTASIGEADSETARFVANSVAAYATLKAAAIPLAAVLITEVKAVYQALQGFDLAYRSAISSLADSMVRTVTLTANLVISVLEEKINQLVSIAQAAGIAGQLGISPVQFSRFQNPDGAQTQILAKQSAEAFANLGTSLDRIVTLSDEASTAIDRVGSAVSTLGIKRPQFTGIGTGAGSMDAGNIGGDGAGRAARGNARDRWGGAPSRRAFEVFNAASRPSAFDDEIDRAITEFGGGVDRNTLRAIIKATLFRESGGRLGLTSSAGAVGPFQVLPGTARMLGMSTAQVSTAQGGANAAVRLMAEYLRQNPNNPEEIFASYFAGPQGGNRGRRTAEYQRDQAWVLRQLMRGAEETSLQQSVGSNIARDRALGIVGLEPSFDSSGRRTGYRGADRPLTADEMPRPQMPGEAINEQLTRAQAAAKATTNAIGEDWQNFFARQENQVIELGQTWDRALIERKNRELDYVANATRAEAELVNLQRENADASVVASRRKMQAREEELDLTQRLTQLEDERANMDTNAALRYEVAWSEAINKVQRASLDANNSIIKSQVQLADAQVFHADRANAKVLDFLAQQRSVTDVIADAKIGVIQSTYDFIDRGLDKMTAKLGTIGSLIKDVLSGFIRLALNKAFAMIFGGSGGVGGGSLFGGGQQQQGGGLFNSIFGGLRGLFGGGASGSAGNVGGVPFFSFAGGGGAGATSSGLFNFRSLGGFLDFGGSSITAPRSITDTLSRGALGNSSSTVSGAAQSVLSSLFGRNLFQGIGFGKTAGTGGALASMLPMLGLGLGAQLGGGSGLSGLLGGAGGLLAGVGLTAAPAFLSTGIFAAGGALGGLGSAATALFSNPFTAIAGAALLIGGILLNRNRQNRIGAQQRTDSIESAISEIYKLISAVNADKMDGASALDAYAQIRSNYLQSVSAIKSSKERDIAIREATTRLDGYYLKRLQEAIDKQGKRKEIDEKLVPEFAQGGGVWSGFAGRVPGVYDRRDDKLIRVSGNEVVLTPKHWQPIQPYLQAAGVPGFADGGLLGNRGGMGTLVVESIGVSVDADGIATATIRTPQFQKAVVKSVRVGVREKEL